jgi:2-methylisocitrate lyase-like PEP mutase family enzyme
MDKGWSDLIGTTILSVDVDPYRTRAVVKTTGDMTFTIYAREDSMMFNDRWPAVYIREGEKK